MNHRSRQGFSLIEFMIAVGLFSVLMLAVAQSFPVQQRTYVVTDQIAEAKQNVRVIADLIERDIRNAGYMMPPTSALCGVDSLNAPDKLYVSDYSRIAMMQQLQPKHLTQSLGAEVQSGANTSNLVLDTVDLDELGGGSDFVQDAGLILADRAGATTAVACGTVTNVGAVGPPGTPVAVQVDMDNTTGPMSPGTDLVAVPAIVYELVNGTLMRNGIPLVTQVEDFQIAWFFDLNDDQNVDPGEYIADGIGGADDYDNQALDMTLLREVRINLVVRTRDEDPNDSWRQGIGQALENRTAGSVAPQDGARRRTHTATIRLRNNLS